MADSLVTTGPYQPHVLDCGRVEASGASLVIAPGSPDFDSRAWRLVRILDGAARCRTDMIDLPCREGDVLLLHPGTRGDFHLAAGARCLQAFFDVIHRERELSGERRRSRLGDDTIQPGSDRVWGLPLPTRIDGHARDTAGLLLVRLSSTYWRDALSHYFADVELATWLADLVAQVAGRDRLHLSPTGRDPVGGSLELAASALSHRLYAEDLARASGLGRSTYFRRFHEVTGSGPATHLRHMRLQRACELLRDPAHSVAQVGRIVGYRSAAAFSRAFARRYGCSPGRWRRGDGRADDC